MKKCSGVWRQRTVDTLNGWYLILVLEWDLVLPYTYSDFAPNAFPASGEEKNGSWLLIRICESVFLLIWNANYNFFKSWTLCESMLVWLCMPVSESMLVCMEIRDYELLLTCASVQTSWTPITQNVCGGKKPTCLVKSGQDDIMQALQWEIDFVPSG